MSRVPLPARGRVRGGAVRVQRPAEGAGGLQIRQVSATPTPSLNTNTNYYCRLCDDTLELGYKEQWCNETNEIVYVDLAQFPTTDVQITCGIVSAGLCYTFLSIWKHCAG